MNPTLQNATDGELVAASLAGSDEHFAQLVRRYQSPLLRVARSRLGDFERAEDVVQETFMNAHRWLHSYDSQYSFRTWLWTILLNQCRRNHARQSRHQIEQPLEVGAEQDDNSSSFAHPQSETPSPPLQLLAKERAELLERSLLQLPDAEADALRLRFYGELKFQEIADAMQCCISTAKNRVRNGLVRLAALVTEEEALAEARESAPLTRDTRL